MPPFHAECRVAGLRAREAPPRSSVTAPPRPAALRCSARGGEAERRERTRRLSRPHPAAAGERKRAPALLPSFHPGAHRDRALGLRLGLR